MFDEPLGALDRSLREELLNQLRTILHQTKIPAIYVTHDQEEAFTIADRVLILYDGQIIREGTPAEVWAHPGSAYVAEFLGLGNILDGEVASGRMNDEGGRLALSGVEMMNVRTALGLFEVESGKHSDGEKVHLLVRPFEVQNEANAISGIVTDVIFQQDRYKISLDNGLYVYLDESPKIGKKISVPVKVECLA
jgi:ABC-type Fe3+/spermidine/putrescine transport system ATPase subunit